MCKVTYPAGMSETEARAYADRARRKYGESNVRAVNVEIVGLNVEITAELVDNPRERISRLHPAFAGGNTPYRVGG